MLPLIAILQSLFCVASPSLAAPSITALAFSPNGAEMAVGSFGSVECRSSTSGAKTSKLLGCPGVVTSIAYSADGKLLAAGGGLAGRSGEVDVWSMPSGFLIARLNGPVDVVQSISWRPGKRDIAGGSYDRSVYLWHVPALAVKTVEAHSYRTLRDHTDAVYAVAYNSDGSRIASAAGDRTVKVWDPETGKRLITLSESTGELYTVAFQPGGRQVAAAGVDRILRVWNPDTGELIKSAFAHDGPILKIAYTTDGHSLISCGQDRAVKQWNADTLADSHDYPRQTEWPQALAVCANQIALGCQDGRCSIYSLAHEIVRANEPATGPIGPIRPIGLIRQETLHARTRLASTSDAPRSDPVVDRSPGNETLNRAQPVPVPVSVSGELWDGKTTNADSAGVSHYYRFSAQSGRPVVIDVMARRSGSPLDSFIQVLELSGKPVERAVLRAVGQSEITLFDKDSNITGIRLLPFPDLHLNDYVLIGRELLRVGTLPKGPDDDTQFRSIHGQRVGYLGTNPEYHSIGTKVYRVDIHPAGTALSPNGMPLTHVMYENDDGGPLYGRDSYLLFTPPATGDYIIRIADSRGQQGKGYTYKLNIHSPRPDYKVSSSPAAITIPKGGREALTVECDRYDGFEGPVHVRLDGLASGYSATETDIEAGETSASILLSAAMGAVGSTDKAPVSFRVICTAEIDDHAVERILTADPAARKLVIGASPGVQAAVDAQELNMKPGGQASVTVSIVRTKGFAGRVPIDVRNLPFGVKVMDVGLNGILVNEKETSRHIVLTCEPWVKAQDRRVYLFAGVEGGVGDAAPPITLHIRP